MLSLSRRSPASCLGKEPTPWQASLTGPVGSISSEFATELRDALSLRRAVETGTYGGGTARLLGALFEQVVTIELDVELQRSAAEALADAQNVESLLGDSRNVLPRVMDPTVPTLYFLDGHWSGGPTAGHADECPVLGELKVVAGGHADDCVIVDDARLFAAAPPPPHDPEQWPTLLEVMLALHEGKPEHHVTMLYDQVIAVPRAVKPVVDAYGRRELDEAPSRPPGLFARVRGAIGSGA
jgi:hypothetical protein